MRVTKAKTQTRHAKKRSVQRFGIVLDVQKAVCDIHKGRAHFLERQSNRVTVWAIEQQGILMPVVYDKMRKTVATVLPEEFLKEFPELNLTKEGI